MQRRATRRRTSGSDTGGGHQIAGMPGRGAFGRGSRQQGATRRPPRLRFAGGAPRRKSGRKSSSPFEESPLLPVHWPENPSPASGQPWSGPQPRSPALHPDATVRRRATLAFRTQAGHQPPLGCERQCSAPPYDGSEMPVAGTSAPEKGQCTRWNTSADISMNDWTRRSKRPFPPAIRRP